MDCLAGVGQGLEHSQGMRSDEPQDSSPCLARLTGPPGS